MGMKAPIGGNQEYEQPPPGNYLGRCNGVYLLGTQPGYQGGDPQSQIMLTFELHKRKGPCLTNGGKGDFILEASRIMSLWASPKSILIEFAGAMRGEPYTEDELKGLEKSGGFDPEPLLGQCCRLALEDKTTNGKTKTIIKSVSALDSEDDKAPKAFGDEVYWDWTLGVECPKRIAYFWERAAENPDSKEAPQTSTKKPYKPAPVSTNPDDIPF